MPFVLYLTNDIHNLGYVGSLAAFINNGKGAAELGGEVPGSGNRAEVRRYNYIVVGICTYLLFEMIGKQRSAEKMVNGQIEKP